MLLEGIFTPVTTPFYPDGRLYLRKLEHNIDRYSRGPVAGLAILGSSGEAVMLSDAETREVLETAAAAAAPHKVLVAGIGRESVAGTIALAEIAANLQYDAVLVRTPHFYRPQMHRAPAPGGSAVESQREMLTYFRAVADHSPLPVLLYTVPPYTAYDLPIDLAVELAQHPNIIGIKESSGKAERIAELVARTRDVRRTATVTPVFAAVTGRMLAAARMAANGAGSASFVSAESLGASNSGGAALAVAPPSSQTPEIKTRTKEVGFQVLAGSAQTLLGSLDAGAVGGVLAFAVPAPQACHEIYTAWKDRDGALALEKQQRIAPVTIRVAGQMGIPGLKHACDLNGYFGGSPRLPLLPLSSSEKAEVASLMADIRN